VAPSGKYRKTIEDLLRALKTFPDDPRFHFALAGAYYLDRDFPGAWRHARKAQTLGFPDVDRFLDTLREVSEEPPEEAGGDAA